MKQLILPPDINEATMLQEMQHRLNLCIKTKQNVHPRTIVAFVSDTLSGITQYYRTVGNIWDSLYAYRNQPRHGKILRRHEALEEVA